MSSANEFEADAVGGVTEDTVKIEELENDENYKRVKEFMHCKERSGGKDGSLAEFMLHGKVPVKVDSDTWYTFFIDLIIRLDSRWKSFCVKIGYKSSVVFHEKHGKTFENYLHAWLKVIMDMQIDPLPHMYWVLEEVSCGDLQQKLLRAVSIDAVPVKPDESEKIEIAKRLANCDKKADGNIWDEEYHGMCLDITNGISPGELETIKFRLRTVYGFKKKALEDIKTSLDLFTILEQRDFLRSNKLSNLKEIIKDIHRNDLLRRVNKYEEDWVERKTSNEGADSLNKEDLKRNYDPHQILYYFRKSISCIQSALQVSVKKIELLRADEHKITCETATITANVDENKDKIQDIDLKIKNLTKEKNGLEMENKNLEEEKRQCHLKQDKILQKIQIQQEEEEKIQTCFEKEKMFKQEQENKQSQEQENKQSALEASSLDTDAGPTDNVSPNTVPGDYRRQHDNLPTEDTGNPRKMEKGKTPEEEPPMAPIEAPIMIMAVKDDQQDLENFESHLKEIFASKYNDNVRTEMFGNIPLPKEVENKLNDKIGNSKLLLLLISPTLISKYWHYICSLNNFNNALYNQRPLIVSVLLKSGQTMPMGLKSGHPLYFYRGDEAYISSLKKLIKPFVEE